MKGIATTQLYGIIVLLIVLGVMVAYLMGSAKPGLDVVKIQQELPLVCKQFSSYTGDRTTAEFRTVTNNLLSKCKALGTYSICQKATMNNADKQSCITWCCSDYSSGKGNWNLS